MGCGLLVSGHFVKELCAAEVKLGACSKRLRRIHEVMAHLFSKSIHFWYYFDIFVY